MGRFKTRRILMSQIISLLTQLCLGVFETRRKRCRTVEGRKLHVANTTLYTVFYKKSTGLLYYSMQKGMFICIYEYNTCTSICILFTVYIGRLNCLLGPKLERTKLTYLMYKIIIRHIIRFLLENDVLWQKPSHRRRKQGDVWPGTARIDPAVLLDSKGHGTGQ